MEAKAVIIFHAVDLMKNHGLLLVSENCVLQNVALDRGPNRPDLPAAALMEAAAEKGPASTVGSANLSGGPVAGVGEL